MKYLVGLFLICCLLPAAGLATPDVGRITGRTVLAGTVLDEAGKPVPGASIVVHGDSLPTVGVASDKFGRFEVRLPSVRSIAQLRVSSIGFLPRTVELELAGLDSLAISVTLAATAIEVGRMSVVPRPETRPGSLTLSAHRVSTRARQSLVPTNPVGAIRDVDVARAGSNHSSQLRIHGTSPNYYMNGVSIGTDPDHYGMFTILPSTVVDRIELQALGTSAEHSTSSVVELQSPERFEDHQTLDVNLSTVEATGTYAVGRHNAFALSALRKSVLDKLVNYFEVTGNHRTLPPTNFQDIAIVSGWKPGTSTRLLFDQYHTEDYLTYRVESIRAEGEVETWQHTSDHFYSLRAEHMADGALIEIAAALTRSSEQYGARPEIGEDPDRLHLNLRQERKAVLLSSKVVTQYRTAHLRAGTQTAFVTDRTVTLEQNNWNFLPPFASSDNPYIYQPALNYSYGSYHKRARESSHAVFAMVERPVGPITFETGLRGEYFGALAAKSALLVRTSLTLPYGPQKSIRLYAGTFAEHPVGQVLEPYQVIVHDQLGRLNPVRTRLYSATVKHGPLALSLFDKRMSNLPVLSPNFDLEIDAIDPNDPDLELLLIGSTGTAHFRGFSAAYEQLSFLRPDLDLSLGYAYTSAVKRDYGVSMPPDLHAPHRFIAHVEYRPTDGVMIGTELSVRSGYPYSESREAKESFEQEDLTPDWYRSQLALENRERFPASASINLFFSIALSHGELYGSVANVTNRENPIINTSSGYISDSGILPTVGIRFRF